MYRDLVNEYISVIQSFYLNHRDKLQYSLRGEVAILLCIQEQQRIGSVTPSEISEKLNVSTARVAVSLNRLEDKKLLTREIDLEDRRKIVINLTEKGIDFATNVKEEHFRRFNYLLEKLGKEDAEELLRIIKSISKILKEGENDA